MLLKKTNSTVIANQRSIINTRNTMNEGGTYERYKKPYAT